MEERLAEIRKSLDAMPTRTLDAVETMKRVKEDVESLITELNIARSGHAHEQGMAAKWKIMAGEMEKKRNYQQDLADDRYMTICEMTFKLEKYEDLIKAYRLVLLHNGLLPKEELPVEETVVTDERSKKHDFLNQGEIDAMLVATAGGRDEDEND